MRSQRFRKELLCAVLNRRAKVAAAAAAAGGAATAAIAESLIPAQSPDFTSKDGMFDWDAHVGRMTEKDFKLRYRVTSKAFHDDLLPKLWDRLVLTGDSLSHARKVVSPAVKLAITLRFMAGGEVVDLKEIYRVDRSYVYTCLWQCVDAINDTFKKPFPISDRAKLDRLEREFRAKSRGGIWEGQVGAIDGVHIYMQGPNLKDCPKPMKYYVQRKGHFALLCMAVCDADRRFTYHDISQEPTTHDSLAWLASELGRQVDAGMLPAPYFFAGDAAFSPTPSMMTPSGGADGLDDYDFHQSSNRMPIECAFGILIRRWAVLYKPLRVAFHRCAPLITACMHMHNFCIDHRIHDETRENHETGVSEIQPDRWAVTPLFDKEGRPVEHLQIERGKPVAGGSTDVCDPKYAMRYYLAAKIAERGLHREQLPRNVVRKQRGKRGRKKKAAAAGGHKKKKQ